ncbi:MAG: hypothetical protein ABSF69_23785 [Polyangiaceae bacterium]|jgi:hypothetical protein
MATPGSSGNVTLNFGAAQSLSYGPLDIPRTQTISNTRRADKLAICNAKTLPDLAKAAPATSDFNLSASAPAEFHLCDAATADDFEQGVVDLNVAIMYRAIVTRDGTTPSVGSTRACAQRLSRCNR